MVAARSLIVIDRQVTLAHQRVKVRTLHANMLGRFADVPVTTAQCLRQESPFEIQDRRIPSLLLEPLEISPRVGNR